MPTHSQLSFAANQRFVERTRAEYGQVWSKIAWLAAQGLGDLCKLSEVSEDSEYHDGTADSDPKPEIVMEVILSVKNILGLWYYPVIANNL